jgi:hypothetical protein
MEQPSSLTMPENRWKKPGASRQIFQDRSAKVSATFEPLDCGPPLRPWKLRNLDGPVADQHVQRLEHRVRRQQRHRRPPIFGVVPGG